MSKKIILTSSDNESFEVDEAVAIQSETIAHLIEDDCVENGVPLANVTSKILVKVIEYCKKHAEKVAEDKKEQVKEWDADFMKVLDRSTVFGLLLAANYLNIKDLLDLSCQAVADTMKDKSVEEVRTMFNVENDFSAEEEAQVREENKWAFE